MEVKISLLEATVVGLSDNWGLKRAALETGGFGLRMSLNG